MSHGKYLVDFCTSFAWFVWCCNRRFISLCFWFFPFLVNANMIPNPLRSLPNHTATHQPEVAWPLWLLQWKTQFASYFKGLLRQKMIPLSLLDTIIVEHRSWFYVAFLLGCWWILSIVGGRRNGPSLLDASLEVPEAGVTGRAQSHGNFESAKAIPPLEPLESFITKFNLPVSTPFGTWTLWD